MLSVSILSALRLNVANYPLLLSVVMLNVIMPGVVAPCQELQTLAYSAHWRVTKKKILWHWPLGPML